MNKYLGKFPRLCTNVGQTLIVYLFLSCEAADAVTYENIAATPQAFHVFWDPELF